MKDRILFIGLGFELELIMRYYLYLHPKNNKVAFTRRNLKKIKQLERQYGVRGYSDNTEAVELFRPSIIFIGVQPKDVKYVIADLLKSSYQSFVNLIFITASLPFAEVSSIFPKKIITNIIPDDHIDIEKPSNIINYCSNAVENKFIEKIFSPTCAELTKVAPYEMIEFTALACQGNPILQLFLKWEKTTDEKKLAERLVHHFESLLNALEGKDSSSEYLDLAKGYSAALNNLSLQYDLGIKVLLLTFRSMIDKRSYYEKGRRALEVTSKKWATVGGYEARGIEIVKEMVPDSTHTVKLKELTKAIVEGMVIRGETINEEIKIAIKEHVQSN